MAVFQIEADGKTYEIDAPDQASALAAFQSYSGQGQQPQADPVQYGGDDSLRSGLMQGMTFNFGDEILAGMMTPIEAGIDAVQGKPFDLGRSYGQALDRNRGTDQQMQAADPTLATVGNIAGSIGSGVGLAKGGVTLMNAAKPTALSMGTRGALEGAAYGALSGAGAGESGWDKVSQAGQGAVIGGALGGLAGGIGGAVANRSVQAAVPSVDDLKSQAGAIYETARNSGVTFPQTAVKTVADDIAAKAITEGLDPTLHPGATAALKRLQEASATGMTVQNAQTVRRILAAAGRDPMNPDQARIAGMMVREFDDFVGRSVPDLAGANQLYSQAKKGELIQSAIQKAQDAAGANFTSAGLDTALRQQFKNLLNNKTALRGFNPLEVAAIRAVVNGGPLENAMRYFGRLAAPTGPVSMMTGAGLPFVAGNAVGGPLVGAGLAAGVSGAGYGARALSSGMTLNNARLAAAMARSGGAMPTTATGAIPAVTQGLVAGGGTQAPRIPMPQLPLPRLRMGVPN